MLVSFYPKSLKPSVSEAQELPTLLDGIRTGQWAQAVQEVRATPADSPARSKAKKALPAFSASGTFNTRCEEGLLTHSGVLALDLDSKQNPGWDVNQVRAQLVGDSYTYALFTSVGGEGLCWLVLVPPSAATHAESFRALEAYARDTYGLAVDSLPDVSRLRFVSCDPELYHHKQANVFEALLSPPLKAPASRPQELPTSNTHGSGALRWACAQVLSAPDGQKHHTLNKMAFTCGGWVGAGLLREDEARAELRAAIGCREVTDSKNAWKTIEDGLSAGQLKPLLPPMLQRLVRLQQREDTSRDTIIQSLAASAGVSAERLGPAVDAVLAEPNPRLLTFWQVHYKEGKRASQDTYRLVVHRGKLREWLSSEGFCFRPAGAGAVEFLHVANNLVRLVERYELKHHVLAYAEQLPPRFDNVERDDLVEMLLSLVRSLFDKEALDCLAPLAGTFLTDSRDRARYFFRNCWVQVTATAITTHPYDELPGLVWVSQVRPYDFRLLYYLEAMACDFHTFLVNITGGDPQRLAQLQRALGYLLHGYKDNANARAVVLVDQVAAAGQPAGGTGKSLLIKAVGEVVKVTQLSGATFRFDDDFRFALVEDDTRLLYFDEWDGRRLPFKKLFTEITSDLVVNRKNRPQVVIPFARSPKFAITTNDVVSGQGSSHKRRKVEIALAPHYSDSHTPKDEFATGFFNEGWGQDEYLYFFNLALGWVQQYLDKGLLLQELEDVEARKVEQDTSPEFVEFARAVVEGESNPLDDKLWAVDLYSQFMDETGDSRSRFTLRHFMKWMERFGFTKVRNTNRGERRFQFYFLKPTK